MTSRYLWSRRQAPLRMVLCGLLPLFSSMVVRAQSIAATTVLDEWRAGFDHQLDDEIRVLGSSHRAEIIYLPNEAQDDQAHMVSQDNPRGVGHLETRHWPSAVSAILRDQGLPTSLIGMVAIESGFNPSALSPKGAAGLWQLMPGTARQYGLVVSASQDDRFDVTKSTVAAARYLRQLYEQFGDWPLALAAYNAGPNRVWQGIHHAKTHDYWTLSRDFSLPDETRDYVPRALAAMRAGFISQNLEPQQKSPSNKTAESRNLLSTIPHRRGVVVFATTTVEVFVPYNAK